jgi:hypothetical protein
MSEKTLLALVAVLVAAVLTGPVACTMNRQGLIADAIKGGSDPIATKCAIESDGGATSAMCLAKALEVKK